MSFLGNKILQLRNEGKSYSAIAEILGCSKSTVSYWCNQDVSAEVKRKTHDRRNKLRKLIQEVKNETPCADCGQRFPYYCMQFDHLPGQKKEFNVGEAKTRMVSLEKLKAEIKKCEVVCANCHAKRTHRRKFGVK